MGLWLHPNWKAALKTFCNNKDGFGMKSMALKVRGTVGRWQHCTTKQKMKTNGRELLNVFTVDGSITRCSPRQNNAMIDVNSASMYDQMGWMHAHTQKSQSKVWWDVKSSIVRDSLCILTWSCFALSQSQPSIVWIPVTGCLTTPMPVTTTMTSSGLKLTHLAQVSWQIEGCQIFTRIVGTEGGTTLLECWTNGMFQKYMNSWVHCFSQRFVSKSVCQVTHVSADLLEAQHWCWMEIQCRSTSASPSSVILPAIVAQYTASWIITIGGTPPVE